jgi:hypothetical protein
MYWSRLRARLTYANVISTVALFLALGGGAYAVSVPRNSVGPSQLKRAAVTSAKLKGSSVTAAKVKNRSLTVNDFKPGLLTFGTAARADDLDPPPVPSATTVARMTLTNTKAGQVFVLGTLRDPFLTCGADICSAHWGVYVDDKPVPDTGLMLSALAGESDGRSHYTLFGVTPGPVAPGTHTIRVARTDSANIASTGQLGSQLGAIQIAG